MASPLIQVGRISKQARIINAVMAAVKAAVLAYFILYTMQLYKNRYASKLATYRDMLLPALIVLFLVGSPVVVVMVLVAWAVSESCGKDLRGLLLAVCVLLGLEVLYQFGVVLSGRVAMGVVGPASMRLGMGVVGRRGGAGSRVSVSA